MAAHIEAENLRQQITAALDEVRRGKEVTIVDHGRVIAKLVPVEPEERVFGTFEGRVVMSEDFDEPLTPYLLAEFEK